MNLRIFYALVTTVFCLSNLNGQDLDQLERFIQSVDTPNSIDEGLTLYDAFGDEELLLLKLGNTYYNAGDKGQARWFYERARFFNPKCELALNNINVIRQDLLEIEEEPFPLDVFKRNVFFFLPGNAWSILVIILASFGLFLFYRRRSGHFVKRWPLILNYSVLIVCVFIAFGKSVYLSKSDRYIVIEANTVLKESPESTSAILNTLQSGNLVFKRDEIGDWLQVELTNGSTGWLQAAELKGIKLDK